MGEEKPNALTDEELQSWKCTREIDSYRFMVGKVLHVKSSKTGSIRSLKPLTHSDRVKGGKTMTVKRSNSLQVSRAYNKRDPSKFVNEITKLMANPQTSIRHIYKMLETILKDPEVGPRERLAAVKLYQDNHKLWFGDIKKIEVEATHTHVISVQDVMKKIRGLNDETTTVIDIEPSVKEVINENNSTSQEEGD